MQLRIQVVSHEGDVHISEVIILQAIICGQDLPIYVFCNFILRTLPACVHVYMCSWTQLLGLFHARRMLAHLQLHTLFLYVTYISSVWFNFTFRLTFNELTTGCATDQVICYNSIQLTGFVCTLSCLDSSVYNTDRHGLLVVCAPLTFHDCILSKSCMHVYIFPAHMHNLENAHVQHQHNHSFTHLSLTFVYTHYTNTSEDR